VLLAAANGDRPPALSWLALSVGLRRGELLGLRWQDLDVDAATLLVARSQQRIGGAVVRAERAEDGAISEDSIAASVRRRRA
jgi:integrase